MDKLQPCRDFVKKLKSFRINHEVFNQGYHVQVMVEHNFYPSKNNYYNSRSGAKKKIPNFKNSEMFLSFLAENNNEEKPFDELSYWKERASLAEEVLMLPLQSFERLEAIKNWQEFKTKKNG